jgi:PAS fold
MNDAAGRMLARGPAELVGKPVVEVLPGVDKRLKQALHDAAPVSFETSLNGAEPYSVRVLPQRHPEGLAVLIAPRRAR